MNDSVRRSDKTGSYQDDILNRRPAVSFQIETFLADDFTFQRTLPLRGGFFVWMWIVVLAILCGGCRSVHQYPMRAVMSAAENVDVTDGVDVQEAVVLAQNLIYSKALHHRLYSLDPIRVQLKKIPDLDGDMVYLVDARNNEAVYQGKQYWEVQFRDKEGSLFWGWYPLYPFFVEINAADGSVVDWGLRKNYPED